MDPISPILESSLDRDRRALEHQLDASLDSFPMSAHHQYGERVNRHGDYVQQYDSADETDVSSSFSRESYHRDALPRHDPTFTTASSDDDDGTVEYPRSAAVHNMRHLDDLGKYDTQRSPTPVNIGSARNSGSSRNLWNGSSRTRRARADSFADGLSGFPSPGSTAQHHASRMTLGAGGIFENHDRGNVHRRKASSGKENVGRDDEYDPERPVSKLVRELEKMDSERTHSAKPAAPPPVVRLDSFSTQPKTSNIFSDSNSPAQKPSHLQPPRHQHRPVQPSPLRSLVVPSPDTSRSKSRESHRPSSVFDHYRYQPRVEDEDEPAPTARKPSSTSPQTSPPANLAPTSRVRVVSNPETKSSKSAAAIHNGEASFLADMTRLTGMLGTPVKGVAHDVVADDGPLGESRNRINHNLKAIYARLHSLEDETTLSRRRIRELEMDLEQSTRDLARDRQQREQVEHRNAVLENEKKELEKLVVVLRREVAKVTKEWHAEMEQTKQLHAQLDNMQRTSPNRVRRTALNLDTRSDTAPSLDTMMDGLIRRIGQLENEVGRLRSVVERAVELKDATFDGERTMRETNDDPRESARPTQYQEGLVAAAYETGDSRHPPSFGRTHQVLASKPLTPPLSDEEDGQRSPLPGHHHRRSHAGTADPTRDARRRRKQNAAGSIHHSRSDEPQDDPAALPFPSIRGERLEKEFFSPPQKVRAGKPSKPAQVDEQPPTEHEDEGYGTEEKAKAAAPTLTLDGLDLALRRNDGKVPPQTLVMSVLREIEDDYEHYLGIYTDLAEQYKRMSPLSIKRHILAEHLKEVIDTMELKANQVARLTEVLQVKDKLFTAPVIKAAQASRARMSVPETVRAVRKDLGKSIVSTPLPTRRQEHAVV